MPPKDGGNRQKLDTILAELTGLKRFPLQVCSVGGTSMPNSREVIAVVASVALVVCSMVLDGCTMKESHQAPAPTTTYAVPPPEQLYQLVAPIALFPDNPVAIVLA